MTGVVSPVVSNSGYASSLFHTLDMLSHVICYCRITFFEYYPVLTLVGLRMTHAGLKLSKRVSRYRKRRGKERIEDDVLTSLKDRTVNML